MAYTYEYHRQSAEYLKRLVPWTPEIGIILLMFGVGLHFHLKDLLAVRHIAVSGALIQIAVRTFIQRVDTQVAIALGASVHPLTKITPSVSATVTAMTGLENTSWQKLENDTSIFYPSFSLFGKILVRSKMTGRKQFHSQHSKLLRLVCFPPVISSVYNDLTRI